MVRHAALVAALLAVCACASLPQPPPPAPFRAYDYHLAETALPDPADDAASIRARAAAQGHVLDEEGLRSNLEQLFATRARRASLPGFAEVWVDYTGEFRWINVGTGIPADRQAYLAMAAPEIRERIRFRRTAFDRAGIEAALARLLAIFPPDSGVCTISYDHSSDWFVIGIEETADEAAIRQRLPADLAPLVTLRAGQCPILV